MSAPCAIGASPEWKWKVARSIPASEPRGQGERNIETQELDILALLLQSLIQDGAAAGTPGRCELVSSVTRASVNRAQCH
jgi:hypothetical protein